VSEGWPVPEDGYKPVSKIGEPVPRAVRQEVTGQLSILEGRRFDPTSVAVKLRLPEGFARTHGIAAALGNGIRRDGTLAPHRDGKDVIGVLIPPGKRKRICAVMGITPKHFSTFAHRAEKLAVGHRCHWGTLCLWVEPFMEQCPGCKENVLLSEKSSIRGMNRAYS